MEFIMPSYHHPDFNTDFLKNAPDCRLEKVVKDGIAPRGYHALSIYPEYFKVNGKWILGTESRMDTVCVVDNSLGNEKVSFVEFRNLKKGDNVVVGRTEDGSEGIYIWTKGFLEDESDNENFAFRSGRSRETAFSIDYDNLYDLLRYEKKNNGYVTLVVGSALVFDKEARDALANIISKGYVNAIFCGTETAAFDLERGIFDTSWGQDIFEREQNTNENLFDTINLVRKLGSIKELVGTGRVKDGFVKACINHGIDLVIAGTIRDRFGLPETINNVYEAQDKMRYHARRTSTVIMMGAILYTVATGNMTPSYNRINDSIRPVYLYTIDIQEFAVNKLSDRGTLTAVSLVTNIQDFIKHVDRALE